MHPEHSNFTKGGFTPLLSPKVFFRKLHYFPKWSSRPNKIKYGIEIIPLKIETWKKLLLDFDKRNLSEINYHLEVYDEEMWGDLLFFNRELNALVAIELKAGKFKPAYLGQLYAYLQVLDDKMRKPHETPSIGIVLCKSVNQAFAEYAVRDYNKPLGVATYKMFSDMPKEMQKALPGIEKLKKLMTTDE